MAEGPPDRQPAIRVTAMPADANPYGDIFGGWLMGQMDMAAGLDRLAPLARPRGDGRDRRDEVPRAGRGRRRSLGLCRLVKVGRTSMTIDVEAWRRARQPRKAAA